MQMEFGYTWPGRRKLFMDTASLITLSLGLRHATDADHVVVVSTLVSGASSGVLGVVLVWRALLPHAWPF